MNKIFYLIIGLAVCLGLSAQIKISSCRIHDGLTKDTIFCNCLKNLNLPSNEKDINFNYMNDNDICIYANSFIELMNNKVNSLIFSKTIQYSDLAIENSQYRIVIHELIFNDSETVNSISKSIESTNNTLPTEALIFFQYFGIANRLIIFSAPRKEYLNKYKKYFEELEHIYMSMLKEQKTAK